MLFTVTAILLAGPSLAAGCATGLHTVHMRPALGKANLIEKRQADAISVPSKNVTHWTATENLREMQVTDDAFNAKDISHFNHANSVKVFYPGGVVMNLTEHITDLLLVYSSFSDIVLLNHNYPVRFAEGDWTITISHVMATNDGPLPGSDGGHLPPTERLVNYDFMTIGHWEYGLLQEEYLFPDNVRSYRQMGLLPETPSPYLPDIPFDPLGYTGPNATVANKMHLNASDNALNIGSTNASELLYSPDLAVYGLTDLPLDVKRYINWLQQMRQAFPDLKYVHQRIIASGEWTATIGMLSGTQNGSWTLPAYLAVAPIRATGKSFNLLHYVIARWDNGTIVDMRVQFDVFGVLAALGINVLG